MRRIDITAYVNDECSLYEILNEVRSEIDSKVFNRKNIRQRKFTGTWEVEKDISSPLRPYRWKYETVAKWESNVITNKEFIQFQPKESN